MIMIWNILSFQKVIWVTSCLPALFLKWNRGTSLVPIYPALKNIEIERIQLLNHYDCLQLQKTCLFAKSENQAGTLDFFVTRELIQPFVSPNSTSCHFPIPMSTGVVEVHIVASPCTVHHKYQVYSSPKWTISKEHNKILFVLSSYKVGVLGQSKGMPLCVCSRLESTIFDSWLLTCNS